MTSIVYFIWLNPNLSHIILASTSLKGCITSFLYPPFNKYLLLFSIIHVFFNLPSVVLFGDIRLIFALLSTPLLNVALVNSESLKPCSKKFISLYSIFESAGFTQYWSDNDNPNALSNNSSGDEIFNLTSNKSKSSFHEGILLPLNQFVSTGVIFLSLL